MPPGVGVWGGACGRRRAGPGPLGSRADGARRELEFGRRDLSPPPPVHLPCAPPRAGVQEAVEEEGAAGAGAEREAAAAAPAQTAGPASSGERAPGRMVSGPRRRFLPGPSGAPGAGGGGTRGERGRLGDRRAGEPRARRSPERRVARGPPSCAVGAAGVGGARRWEPQDLGRDLRADLSVQRCGLTGWRLRASLRARSRAPPKHEQPGDRGGAPFRAYAASSPRGNGPDGAFERCQSFICGWDAEFRVDHGTGPLLDAKCRVYMGDNGSPGRFFFFFLKKWDRVGFDPIRILSQSLWQRG